MKSTIIFADKDLPESKKELRHPQTSNKPKVMLSQDEYREVVKQAYKEGLKDALTENIPPPNHPNPLSEKMKNKNAGEKQAAQTEAKEGEQTKRKLKNIQARHDMELLRVKGVFPFDLFPDSIIIDTTKVTLVRKQMFATENIITIPLKDLADAHVQTALFLASITIAYMPHSNSPGMLKPEEETIACLRRADAIRAKNIIKGVLVAQAEEIDLAKLSPDEVSNVIEKFGHSEGVT